ncbi:MAG TPA: winged helix-turn-helix domain-containing protein [Pseudolabrys sp.]|jgi:non-specific serine/threonine protein kinase|nr:winged helix-turn-helix domain-containing protein [Pseudolabrys sp.]
MSAASVVRYSFGHFELQPSERRLLADGLPISVPPRAFDLLVVLAERHGHLVTKEDLLRRVWPGVVVEENALHAQISALRKVLGAATIATISGAGYRFAVDVARSGAEAAPEPSAGTPHNLPRPLTSFVGRERQIGELKELLHQTRLLTLSGAGGCGKSRLALELAGQLLDTFPDGLWLVELAAVANQSLVPQMVADTLGLKERGSETLTTNIVKHIGSNQVLLVIDNAEHLLGACGELAEALLRRCEGLSIVVTSRERLGVPGELTYRVPSLSVADPMQRHNGDTLAAYESAQLFVARARLHDARFAITDQSASAVASICSQLDGIPLAIELAAARVRVISVDEVNKRLDQRFRLLTDNSSTALPRQRTLRALIDWSYDLLNSAEKTVFSRAAVFADGFTLDAAEHVLSGGSIDEEDVLDLLTSLTDKSLIQAEYRAGITRFRQLETVRQYSRDRLRESGDEAACRLRHSAHFLALAQTAEEALRGPERVWLSLVSAEHENIRAALVWSLAAEGDPVTGLRIASSLFPFWLMRGFFKEGREWVKLLLDAVPQGVADEMRAKGLSVAGWLALYQADEGTAKRMLEESLLLWRTLGDRRGLSVALHGLASLRARLGDLAGARTLYEESLLIKREAGNRWGTARVLDGLSSVLRQQGNIALARISAQEALALERELDAGQYLYGLHRLAEIELAVGNAAAASNYIREALLTHDAAPVEDDLLQGRATHANSVNIERLAAMLETMGYVQVALGHWSSAALMLGHAAYLRDEGGLLLSHADLHVHERNMAAARAELGESAFDSTWRDGRALASDQIVRIVLYPPRN